MSKDGVLLLTGFNVTQIYPVISTLHKRWFSLNEIRFPQFLSIYLIVYIDIYIFLHYYNYQRSIGDLSETNIMHDRRNIGDSSETDMPDWRPIGDLDMLHQRPTCPFRDRHTPLETNMPVDTHRRPICWRFQLEFKLIYIYLNKFTYFYILLAY